MASLRLLRSPPGIATAAKRKSGGQKLPHRQKISRGFRGGKIDCCSTGSVSLKNINSPTFYSSYHKRRPIRFVYGDSRRKSSFICLEAWMSNASGRGNGHQNFAPSLPVP